MITILVIIILSKSDVEVSVSLIEGNYFNTQNVHVIKRSTRSCVPPWKYFASFSYWFHFHHFKYILASINLLFNLPIFSFNLSISMEFDD